MVTNLPAAWVPCDTDLTQARDISPASTRQIIRRIPLVYTPGNSIAVTLEISPSTSMAVAVEDQVPEGWTVTDVADGGEYDPVNRRVKWGPFLDGAARVLHYQLSPPASIQPCLTMAGVGSFDGISQAVQGDQALVPSGHLEIRPAGDSPAMRLRIFGEPRRVYTVEVSSNLRQWTQLTEVIGADSPIEVFTSISRTEPMRFYRVRLSLTR
jgi:hypothetical protein